MLPFLGADLRLQVEFPLFSLATAAYRPTFQLTFSTAAEYYPDFAAASGGKRSFESPDAGGHKQSFHEIFAMIRKNQVARIPANDIKTQRI
jgi:hypothetical protein